MSATSGFICYIEDSDAVKGAICSLYVNNAWYSDLTSRSIKLDFDIADNVTMRYLAFAVSSNNYEWEVLHIQDKQNNTPATVTIPDTYDGAVKFGIKLYDTPPTVGSVLNVGFDYVITGGIDLSQTSSTNVHKIKMECDTSGATIRYTTDGSNPSETSVEYIEEIEVEAPATIKARGFKEDFDPSDIATLVIESELEKLATPTISASRVDATSGKVTISNYASYPSGTTIDINGSSYTLANEITVTITSAETQIGVSAVCDGYLQSDVATATIPAYTMPKLQTPTLSLSRSGSTVSGTIGNTVSGATYRYKVGSAPSSETDGTAISGTTFSFTNSSAVTVYVKGFMDGYEASDAVSDSVEAQPSYPAQGSKLPTPNVTMTTHDYGTYQKIRFTFNNNSAYSEYTDNPDANVGYDVYMGDPAFADDWVDIGTGYYEIDWDDYIGKYGDGGYDVDIYATDTDDYYVDSTTVTFTREEIIASMSETMGATTVPIGSVLSDGSVVFYDRGSEYGNYSLLGGILTRLSSGADDGSANNQNWRFLICDKQDLTGTKQWGQGNVSESLTGAETGLGLPNTNAMISKYATNDSYWWKSVKEKRDSTGKNWFIPSKAELSLVYTNKSTIEENGIGSFVASFYWTSSELSSNEAYYMRLSNGLQTSGNKTSSGGARLIYRI